MKVFIPILLVAALAAVVMLLIRGKNTEVTPEKAETA
jgi:hypothetical protein